MGMNRCPVCREWYRAPDYAVDYVHQCINEDGTRLTTKLKKQWIPGKINIKVFDDDDGPLGANIPLPDKKLSKRQIEEEIHEEEEVNTYIPLG